MRGLQAAVQAALMADLKALQEDSMVVGGLMMRDSRFTVFVFDLETQGADN